MARRQNNNNSDNDRLSNSEIDNILSGINNWIGNVDTKISFVLTLACIFLGYIIENDITIYKNITTQFPNILLVVLLTISLLCSIISIMLLIMSLKAINKHVLVNYESVIFAGDIAKSSTFEEYNRKLSSQTDNKLLNDKKKQIYINANIYNQKVKTYNAGLWLTIATVITYIVYKILVVEL